MNALLRSRKTASVTNLLLLIFGFGLWVMGDYFYVTSATYPNNVSQRHDSLGWLFPGIVAAANLYVFRAVPIQQRIAISCALALLVTAIEWLAITLFGMPLHFRFGGQL